MIKPDGIVCLPSALKFSDSKLALPILPLLIPLGKPIVILSYLPVLFLLQVIHKMKIFYRSIKLGIG